MLMVWNLMVKILLLKMQIPTSFIFCDRPVRIAGHMIRGALLKLGTEGENSFRKNHPPSLL